MDTPPVQYVRTSDDWNIAYRVSGEGSPLVLLPPAMSSVLLAWDHYPGWLSGLAGRFRLVQYDLRGEGLSGRGLPDATQVTDFVLDLEAVVERLGLRGFALWAGGSRCHHAIRYAHRHADKVAALFLNTCSVTGWRSSRMIELPNESWNLFLRALAPFSLSAEQRHNRVEDFRRCMTREDWGVMMSCLRSSNVEAEARELRVPTLVMHPRDWPSLGAEESMNMAALIPGSSFVLIDGEDVFGDATQGLAAIDSFLAQLPPRGTSRTGLDAEASLSDRELEVLRLVAAGQTNQQIADELVISLNTARKHVANILDKTGTANRTEAAGYARDHGLA
jgi:DNA-binding CsgD family transcriptional regulator/pimeloyl-ACP methyl ester carboxylesterase